jgi:hypothetical protein
LEKKRLKGKKRIGSDREKGKEEIYRKDFGSGSGTGSGFNRASGSGFGIRIRIQEGKNDPQK